MNRLLVALIAVSGPLAGCVGGDRASDNGQCPAGEVCSPDTPDGLQFIGSSLVGSFVVGGPLATAIGGTQEVELDLEPALGIYTPFDQTYTVDDQGGTGVRFDHQNGNIVTVRGAGSFSNYLRILDPSTNELFDRKQLTGAQIDSIAIVPETLDEIPQGMPIAFASGDAFVGIALSGQVQGSLGQGEERLVDTSLVATLDGSTRRAWDTLELPNAAAGTYTLSVTAGNQQQATQLPVAVVDGADSIVELDPTPTIAPGDDVCFAALSDQRFVVGLAWTFEINGVATGGTANCVTSDQPSGTMNITASAGGQTFSVATTVVQSAVHRASHLPQSRPTAGERAAM
jgi:hypothetical protein